MVTNLTTAMALEPSSWNGVLRFEWSNVLNQTVAVTEIRTDFVSSGKSCGRLVALVC